MERHALYVIQFQVDADKEEEFNEWYNKYVESLQPPAADFVSARRYVSIDGDKKTYLTIYEIKDEASIDEAMSVFERPERQASRQEWRDWAAAAVRNFSDQTFVQFYP